MLRFRNLLLVAILVSVAAVLVACGGSGDGGGASADQSPQQVLNATFASGKSIKSANIDAKFSVSSSGATGANFDATLTGAINGLVPTAPQFDLKTKINGSQNGGPSTSLEAGAILTDTAAYLTYAGQNYSLGAATFDQFKAGLAAGQNQQKQDSGGLGSQADIKSFLTNVQNEGTEDVAGTESVHVSGDVDVQKLAGALRPLIQAAGSLDSLSGGGSVPGIADLDQLQNSIKSASFDVYSSEETNQLTRFVLDIEINEPTSGDSKIGVDVTITDAGEDLKVTAPTDSVPLDDFLGGAGLGGALGGDTTDSGGGSAGAPSPGGSSGSTPVPEPKGLKQYQDCLGSVTKASDLEKCQQLLS